MFLTQFTMVTTNVAGALAQHVQLAVKPLAVIPMNLSKFQNQHTGTLVTPRAIIA